jgi:hypothetical protein
MATPPDRSAAVNTLMNTKIARRVAKARGGPKLFAERELLQEMM